jgi:hypothetical protein
MKDKFGFIPNVGDYIICMDDTRYGNQLAIAKIVEIIDNEASPKNNRLVLTSCSKVLIFNFPLYSGNDFIIMTDDMVNMAKISCPDKFE